MEWGCGSEAGHFLGIYKVFGSIPNVAREQNADDMSSITQPPGEDAMKQRM